MQFSSADFNRAISSCFHIIRLRSADQNCFKMTLQIHGWLISADYNRICAPGSTCIMLHVASYIAFVNFERWLAKSRVGITQCQHGKFLSLYFFVLYLKKSTKHFPYWYTIISTLVEIGKTRNCAKTFRTHGVVFPLNFSFSQFPRMLIYNRISTLKMFYIYWKYKHRTLELLWLLCILCQIDVIASGGLSIFPESPKMIG